MLGLTVTLDSEGAWPDIEKLKPRDFYHLANSAPPIQIAVMDRGLASGRPSVAIRIDLPDGRVVVAETTARLYCTAANAIMAKYPDLFRDH